MVDTLKMTEVIANAKNPDDIAFEIFVVNFSLLDLRLAGFVIFIIIIFLMGFVLQTAQLERGNTALSFAWNLNFGLYDLLHELLELEFLVIFFLELLGELLILLS